MNLEKLREEIARILREDELPDDYDPMRGEYYEALGDRILAIPSIATALRFTDLHRQAGNVVGDPKLK